MKLLRRGEHLSDRDLFELAEGELPPDRSKLLWGHMSRCPECRRRFTEWTDARRVVSELPVFDAPSRLTARVRQRLSEPEQPRVPAKRQPAPLVPLGAAAAAVLLLLVGYGIYGYRQSLRDASARHAARMEQRLRPAPRASIAGRAIAAVDWGSATATVSGEVSTAERPLAIAAPTGPSPRPVERTDAEVARRPGPVEPAPGPTDAESPAARLEFVSGTPVLARGDAIRNADAGAPLAPGDSLRTDDTDRALIEFRDGGEMVMSFDTELKFPGTASGCDEPGFSAELLKGQVWAWSPGDGERITINTAKGSGRIHRGEALVRFYGPQAVPLAGRGDEVQVVAFGGRVQFADLQGNLATVNPGQILLADRDPRHLQLEPVVFDRIITISGGWGKRRDVWRIPTTSGVELLRQLDAPRISLGAKFVAPADDSPGLRVASIEQGSQAERADLSVGDHVLRIGDVGITTLRDVAAAELLLPEAAEPTLVVRRNDAEVSLQLRPVLTQPELCEFGEEGPRQVATLAAAGDIAKAVALCLRLAAEKPSCTAQWYNLGLLREYQGRNSEALAAHKRARAIDPQSAPVLTALGRTYGRIGNLMRAESALLKSNEIAPSSMTQYLLGRTAILGADLLAAEHWSNVLLQSSSAEDQAWGEILSAQLAYLRSDFRAAARRADDASSLDPANLEAVYYHAATISQDPDIARTSRLTRATQLLRPLLRIWPDMRRAINLMSTLTHHLGDWEEARWWSEHGLAMWPDSPILLCNRGAMLVEENRPDEAIAYCAKALESDPTFIPAHMRLARAAQDAAKLDLAIEHYLDTLELNPGDEGALHRVVSIYREQGRDEEAERLLQRHNLPALFP